MEENLINEKLKTLKILFELSDNAFCNYLEEKFYLHALCINKYNKMIYNHIIDNSFLWPVNLQIHIIKLLTHLDIWMIQFSDFEKQRNYKLNEPFVFFHLDNKSAYPKDSVGFIKTYVL